MLKTVALKIRSLNSQSDCILLLFVSEGIEYNVPRIINRFGKLRVQLHGNAFIRI